MNGKGIIMIKTIQVQGVNDLVAVMLHVSEGRWNPNNHNGYIYKYT